MPDPVDPNAPRGALPLVPPFAGPAGPFMSYPASARGAALRPFVPGRNRPTPAPSTGAHDFSAAPNAPVAAIAPWAAGEAPAPPRAPLRPPETSSALPVSGGDVDGRFAPPQPPAADDGELMPWETAVPITAPWVSHESAEDVGDGTTPGAQWGAPAADCEDPYDDRQPTAWPSAHSAEPLDSAPGPGDFRDEPVGYGEAWGVAGAPGAGDLYALADDSSSPPTERRSAGYRGTDYGSGTADVMDDAWAAERAAEAGAGDYMAPDLARFLPARRTPPGSGVHEGYAAGEVPTASAWWNPDSAEYVAAALEAVARRVREGSLTVGEVEAGAGESAAVAAALAALLGVRR